MATYEPRANSQPPKANSQQPTANRQQPTANSQKPRANNISQAWKPIEPDETFQRQTTTEWLNVIWIDIRTIRMFVLDKMRRTP